MLFQQAFYMQLQIIMNCMGLFIELCSLYGFEAGYLFVSEPIKI